MARILIIEDDQDIAMMYSHVQKLSGYDVMIARSAEVVMKKIGAFNPHVCIIDLFLPGESGVSLAPQIRQLYPDMAMIAISAYIHRWTSDELVDAGFDRVLAKPASLYDLRHVITEVIRKHYCPCEENLCLPNIISDVSPDTMINKTCTMCGAYWQTLGELHADKTVYLNGFNERIAKGSIILQFNHVYDGCGTTFAIEFDYKRGVGYNAVAHSEMTGSLNDNRTAPPQARQP